MTDRPRDEGDKGGTAAPKLNPSQQDQVDPAFDPYADPNFHLSIEYITPETADDEEEPPK